MTSSSKIIGLLFFVLLTQLVCGQTNKEKAILKDQKAIQLMDSGKIDQSIVLLKEAKKLDPDNFNYSYDLARAHYLKKDYKEAIHILEKHSNDKAVTDLLFQLLGNSYNAIGKSEKAGETYEEGLKLFPNSGAIYFEKGNVLFNKKEYRSAFNMYEKGIEVDPKYTSNYYKATYILCRSTEEVWGMIYGEIFMNLERNTVRNFEIGKSLFDTYKSQITLIHDSLFTVSFSQNTTMRLDEIINPIENDLPYGFGVYEPTLMQSLKGVTSIDINSLSIIRTNFINFYFKNGYNVTYPNILFDYHKKLIDAGHFEAYNHWVLMKGDQERFQRWLSDNKTKWDSFINWFAFNELKVDTSNRFYRNQYIVK